MNKFSIFIFVSWVFFTGSPRVNTDNTIVTRYTEEDILLKCSPDFQHAVGWQYLAHGAKYRSAVSVNSELVESYVGDGRYSLKINQTIGRYDLLITKLILPDAGTYFCHDHTMKLIIKESQRHLLVVPSNTVASVGQQVQFHCSTSHQHPVFWQRVVRETGKVLELFVGNVEALASSGKYDMRVDATTGQYDLVILDVQTSDAGTYICLDESGFGRKESAELIVLVSMLSCQSNADKNGVLTQNDCGLEPEYVMFSCGARFVGNSAPTLQWKRYNPEVNESATPAGTLQVYNSTVTSKLSFQAEFRLVANSIYTCEINEYVNVDVRCQIPQIKALYCFNSTQIQHTKLVSIASEQNSLTCFANTSQNCSYHWINPGNPDVTVSASQQVLLSDDQCGQFRCLTKCNLKGTVCTFSSASITIHCVEDSTPIIWNIGIYISVAVITLLVMIILILVAIIILFCKQKCADLCTQVIIGSSRWSRDQVTEVEELLTEDNVDYQSVDMTQLGKIEGTRKEEEVRGLTVLEMYIYIVRLKKNEIEVYDSNTFQHICDVKVKGLGTVRDMTSCSTNNCLYVSDEDNNTIHKIVLPNVDKIHTSHKYVITTWSMDDTPEGLSVEQTKLIVTCVLAKKIIIYDTNGNCSAVINLDESIHEPWHSFQLKKNIIVLSHGRDKEVGDSADGVCTIDSTGRIIQRYDGNSACRINRPIRIAATCTNFVFLCDYHNDRMLLLDQNLKAVSQKKLEKPTRVCLDKKLHMLYVALDNDTSDVLIIELFKYGVQHTYD